MPTTNIHVRFLQLTRDRFVPKRSDAAGLAFNRVEPPMPALSRYLYCAVGAPWFWLDRRPWSLERWAAHLTRPGVETWLLTKDGVPAGYVEFETREGNAAEIVYFGLLPGFIAQGLGGHLLSAAVDRIFETGATAVMLETCDLDHEHALANYKARGFVETGSVIRTKQMPEEAPGPW
jgi:ribosomal protein S18 acetylase RimI-like enzyme